MTKRKYRKKLKRILGGLAVSTGRPSTPKVKADKSESVKPRKKGFFNLGG